MTTAIIGSGFAGVAAAHGLGKANKPAVVFEAKDHWGGHTYSDVHEGFVFDEGPHLSFTADERVKDIFLEGAEGKIENLPARVTNYYEGKWLTHPAQVHLYGLDPDFLTSIITDMIEIQANPPEIKDYGDWLTTMYGHTFAQNFPYRYTRKYWTLEPEQMGIDWVGKRMYPPKIGEVVRGALAPGNEGDFHYLKSYRYPSEGGYQSFMKKLAADADIRTNKEVLGVNPVAKTLRFGDGSTETYEQLISSMPLDLLVQRIEGIEVPAAVQQAAQELLCTSVVLVDIAVDRADLFDHEWFYVYDEDIAMSRVHFPHMLAPSMAPEGKGSIQAEVYFSRERPLQISLDEVVSQAIDDFIRMGILRNRDEVLWSRPRVIQYANIVFDHKRAPALEKIKPFIEQECGIILAGRFGEWDYHWTDDATNAGWKAAAQVVGTTVDELLA